MEYGAICAYDAHANPVGAESGRTAIHQWILRLSLHHPAHIDTAHHQKVHTRIVEHNRNIHFWHIRQ